MVFMLSHPTSEELQAFALGSLECRERIAIEEHLADCLQCQEEVTLVADDPLIGLLRRVYSGAMAGSPTLSDAFSNSQMEEDVSLEIPIELTNHERYHVVGLLGKGGMGCVFQAEHRILKRSVALKVIHHAYTNNPIVIERFSTEIRAAASLAHPNIVKAFDAETEGEATFLVMEYVEGKTLGKRIRQEGIMPIEQACEYIRQAALGLHHAHKMGLVHRDIKPDNLIVTPEGCVKILDFGLASLSMGTRPGGFTEPNVVMGTPDYLAPEQAEDSSHADARSDIYSLGCTLFHLLTGTPPFPGDTPAKKIHAHRQLPVPSVRNLRPDVPKELETVVARMMAKRPVERFQTAAEVVEVLSTVLKQSPLQRTRRRQSLLLTLTALVGLALAGIVIHRIQTDTGELVIETHGEDVEIIVKQNGKIVRLIDTKTNKSVTLHSGSYQLETKGAKGLSLDIDQVTLKRGQTVLAGISRSGDLKTNFKRDEQIRLIPWASGDPNEAPNCHFSADGRILVVAMIGHGTRLIDVKTWKLLREIQTQYVAYLTSDNRRLISATYKPHLSTRVQVFDANTSKLILQTPLVSGWLWNLGITPNGDYAVTIYSDFSVRLWDLKTGKLRRFWKAGGDVPHTKVPADEGTKLVFYNRNNQDKAPLKLWDLAAEKEIHRPDLPNRGIFSSTFLKGGKQMVVGHSGALHFHDMASGKLLRTIPLNKDLAGEQAREGVVSRDGRLFFGPALDGSLQLWDLTIGQEIARWSEHGRQFYRNVDISPDGKFAVIGKPGRAVVFTLPKSVHR